MALEDHWGLSRTPEGQLRLVQAVPSVCRPTTNLYSSKSPLQES